MKKPTIEELEKILTGPSCTIVLNSDGSISTKHQDAVYEIQGYGVVLPQVQNVYQVEKDKCECPFWGFKYLSGVFEYFNYKDEKDAQRERGMFIEALNGYWSKK